MSIHSLLSRWRADPDFNAQITAWEAIPAVAAQTEPLPHDLHPHLRQALAQQGIAELYAHQATGLRAAWAGQHVVIVTSTASGKSLGYNLPVLDAVLRNDQARALYLFPTKALAQDQLNSLRSMINLIPESSIFGTTATISTPITAAIYDGDTPSSSRPAIREKARIVLSNPDMLHTGILPHHTAWAAFFRDLRFVVIDEMHVYRGVFGSHVANVLRRLKRIARFYGSQPQYILTSATIANPLELAERLIEPEGGGDGVTLVDRDSAAHGQKHFLIYNPPIIDGNLGLRRSAIQESVRLASDMLSHDVQTILFGRSRRAVELLLSYLREKAGADQSPWPSLRSLDPHQTIRGYRSGYLPQQRREIEQGLRQGTVRAVVATNALELGIDIGAMGAALLVGYPGSIAGTWQQAGRAGRGEQAALAVLVATADPLDQFLASHPEYFFGRSPEQALINPDNLLILLAHVRCAAFELPFHVGDRFGGIEPARLQEFLDFLVEQGLLHASRERYFWMADRYPAQEVSLRSASSDNILLQVEDSPPAIIGEVDRMSAFWLVHPNAIYLHEGQSYLVENLDLEQNIAHLRRIETDYYTEHRSESSVRLVEVFEQQPVHGGEKAYGEIIVTSQVIGYRQIQWQTHQQLGLGELSLPPTDLQTTAYWLTLAEETVEYLRVQGLWSNDPNQYGPTWARQRDRARARDGYRCQVCNAPEVGRAHDVHHKIPFRAFASAEIANQLENLVTLCPTCHRRVETAVRVRSGLSGLGFVLGHLAPLFLMCDARDLGVHSDPQSPLTEGRPTVVIYDQIPAGIGLSQRLFELHADLVARAKELVAECPCLDGCPSCVGPGGEQGQGSKKETLAILDALVA
jgi:DEAD/DEAH box helicase domain-containing protein